MKWGCRTFLDSQSRSGAFRGGPGLNSGVALFARLPVEFTRHVSALFPPGGRYLANSLDQPPMALALLAKLGGKSGWHPRRFAAVGGIAGRAGRAWRPAAASVIAVPRSLWMAFANPAAIATGGAGRHQRLRPDEGSDKIRGAAGGAKDRRPTRAGSLRVSTSVRRQQCTIT